MTVLPRDLTIRIVHSESWNIIHVFSMYVLRTLTIVSNQRANLIAFITANHSPAA